jgi:hypothetical protein
LSFVCLHGTHSHTHTRNSDTNTEIFTHFRSMIQNHTHIYIHTQSRTHTDARHNHTLITSTLVYTLTLAKALCSHWRGPCISTINIVYNKYTTTHSYTYSSHSHALQHFDADTPSLLIIFIHPRIAEYYYLALPKSDMFGFKLDKIINSVETSITSLVAVARV